MGPPAAKKQKSYHNKRGKYFQPQRRQFIEVGQRGFLATCNFREKDCIRECYNILNQYADELYGAQVDVEPPNADPANAADIVDSLQSEIDAAAHKSRDDGRKSNKTRFQVVDTGATNCLFIRTTLTDPVELGTRIITDIAATHEQRSRYLLRLVPIEVVCKANLADIVTAGGALFDKYFLKQGSTFSIVFNKRYNNDVKREDVIKELAAIVQSKNASNSVDLRSADNTVLVEVIKGLCCLSVVPHYLKYKKYNLVELALSKNSTAEAAANGAADDVGSEPTGAAQTGEEPNDKDSVEPVEPVEPEKATGDCQADATKTQD